MPNTKTLLEQVNLIIPKDKNIDNFAIITRGNGVIKRSANRFYYGYLDDALQEKPEASSLEIAREVINVFQEEGGIVIFKGDELQLATENDIAKK